MNSSSTHYERSRKMFKRTAAIITSILVCIGMLLYFPDTSVSFADTADNDSGISDPYLKQSISEMYSGGDLTLPDGITGEELNHEEVQKAADSVSKRFEELVRSSIALF